MMMIMMIFTVDAGVRRNAYNICD